METSRNVTGDWPAAGAEPVLAFGHERRMHARAYDHWVSLLRGRRMPAMADLDPAALGTLAGNSVLIHLAAEHDIPSIAFLGDGLRAQAGVAPVVPGPEAVPADSLLGQLLARFPDIVARRAPVGFEAEHVTAGGTRTLHRGILLPLARDDGSLGAVYGVINGKTMAAVAEVPDIAAAVDAALGAVPLSPGACAWGDGPGAALPEMPPQPLGQQLAAARTWAALAATDRTRGAAALHAALGAAHDFLIAARADPAAFAALLSGAGEAQPSHAVRMVFGESLGRHDRATFVAVLRHAVRLGLGRGGLAPLLDRYSGGPIALAHAERRARRLARRAEQADAMRAELADAPTIGEIALMPVDPDFLLLLGRRGPRAMEVVARVDDAALTEAALARVRAA